LYRDALIRLLADYRSADNRRPTIGWLSADTD